MLYYLPLEPYQERYTMQLSAPDTGWFERNWKRYGVEYKRINPQPGRFSFKDRIVNGQVIDATTRGIYAMSQITVLLQMLEENQIKDSDTIYLDDFWHPGIEAFKYACHQFGIRPRMYAYLWAQSVDEFDFTHDMRSWMRHYEKGNGAILDGIFVANTGLKELLIHNQIAPESAIHVVGLPFCTEEVMERMLGWYQLGMGGVAYELGYAPDRHDRHDRVIFSSRCDKEKNPDFFVAVAKEIYKINPGIQFVICSSAKEIKSNDHRMIEALNVGQQEANLTIQRNLTKEQYYELLCTSKIQFNCASQDWTSFTLLEASAAGSFPIYPYFRSFPETLLHHMEYFYAHKNLNSAVNAILGVIYQLDRWSKEAINSRSWIHRRFDTTWLRILDRMNIEVPSFPYFVEDPRLLSPFAPNADKVFTS